MLMERNSRNVPSALRFPLQPIGAERLPLLSNFHRLFTGVPSVSLSGGRGVSLSALLAGVAALIQFCNASRLGILADRIPILCKWAWSAPPSAILSLARALASNTVRCASVGSSRLTCRQNVESPRVLVLLWLRGLSTGHTAYSPLSGSQCFSRGKGDSSGRALVTSRWEAAPVNSFRTGRSVERR